MKRLSLYLLALSSLLTASACSSESSPPRQETAVKPPAEQYTDNNGLCSAQAERKLKLFDRPDTYPISDQERNNARTTLFNECMSAHEPVVAGAPRSDTQQAASAQDAAALAALSPAAGGNPPAPTTSYPGSTVIMVQGSNVSQLGALSPSSGGTPSTNGSTVVVVQAPGMISPQPPAAAPHPVAELPTALARPIEVSPPKPLVTTALTPSPAPQPPKILPASGSQDTEQLEQILTK